MAKKVVTLPEMRKSVHSIHAPDGLWKEFVGCFAGLPDDSASAQITQWIKEFLNERKEHPEATKAFNYDLKVQEKTQMLKKEIEQRTLLEKYKTKCSKGSITVFETLNNFAISLIKPKKEGLLDIEEVEEARQKLIDYQLDGSEDFNRSNKLIFVHYLDYVLKRRTLEREIEEYLQNSKKLD